VGDDPKGSGRTCGSGADLDGPPSRLSAPLVILLSRSRDQLSAECLAEFWRRHGSKHD